MHLQFSIILQRKGVIILGKDSGMQTETKPFTLRVSDGLEARLTRVMMNEGFSNRADVVLHATRLFMEMIYARACTYVPNCSGDKTKYQSFMKEISGEYSGLLDSVNGSSGSEKENLSFRIPVLLLDEINNFNSGSLKYRNAQEFMRTAAAWYIVDYETRNRIDIEDLWRETEQIESSRSSVRR